MNIDSGTRNLWLLDIDSATQTLEVFHNVRFTRYDKADSINFNDIHIVAHLSFAKDTMMLTALDKAFATTQNVDHSWAERPRIDSESATKPYLEKARSTSVGDIMRCVDRRSSVDLENITIGWWVVENTSFIPLAESRIDGTLFLTPQLWPHLQRDGGRK